MTRAAGSAADDGSVRSLLPGFLVCAMIALAASFVSEHYGGPKFLYALLLGVTLHFLSEHPRCAAGIDMSARKLVRIGVALLGARIVFSDVADLGYSGVAALAGTVVFSIGFGILLARMLGLPSAFGLLSGGGTGICGISATLAISSTLPQSRENEHYTLLAAIGVASFSTVAMVLYPLVATALGFDATEAGMFLGGSIHDVAQVVGAGFTISPAAGDAATLAKMFRVAMLVPVVLLLALVFRGVHAAAGDDGRGPARQPLLPFFLIAFAALVLVNSLGWIPGEASSVASMVSHWCLVIAVAALGVKTSFGKLAALGWRPIALLAGEAVFVALYMLAVVFLVRAFSS